jgi:hypothetical protein
VIIFQLLAGKYNTLLVWRNLRLILDLCLDVCDGVRNLNVNRDRFARHGLNENLHVAVVVGLVVVVVVVVVVVNSNMLWWCSGS